MKLLTAVRASVRELAPADVDRAAVELALHYARQLDTGGDSAKLGPLLLSCLESLGMTPRSRRASTKGAADARNPLDELRERRDRRRKSS